MNRRRFLGLAGSIFFAGCSTLSGRESIPSQTPETTPTRPSPTASAPLSPTPTETPRPEPESVETPVPVEPRVLLSNPVYRWNGVGDIVSNAITSVGKGTVLPISAKFNIQIHNSTVDYTSQVTAFDSDGSQVGFQTDSLTESIGEEGYVGWEAFVTLNTTEWDFGQYSGEYIVRDNIMDETSSPKEWMVEIVEPLRESEAVVKNENIPTVTDPNQTVHSWLTIENRTDRDSSIVSPISRRGDGGWVQIDEKATYNIPSDESVEFYFKDIGLSGSGVYEYRLDTVDITWTLNVDGS